MALATASQAQEWPQRPVRILVPYAAGGNSDSMARLAAQRLSEAFGQQFVVENRVGSNGGIAGEAVARATPDGYTLLWAVQPPLTISPAMTKVPYDPQKDFAPISVVGTNPFVLVVNKDVPAKTVAEFIAWAKPQQGKLSYAESSVGSLTHLSMALFLKRAGLEMTNVSYRGNAPALTDVIAGHINLMSVSVSLALPPFRAGQIKLFGIGSTKRLGPAADIPTVAENGLPGYEAATWFGLFATAGTPRDVVMKLNAEIQKILADPDFREKFLAPQMFEPMGSTPKEFADHIKAQTQKWAKVIREQKLSIDK